MLGLDLVGLRSFGCFSTKDELLVLVQNDRMISSTKQGFNPGHLQSINQT